MAGEFHHDWQKVESGTVAGRLPSYFNCPSRKFGLSRITENCSIGSAVASVSDELAVPKADAFLIRLGGSKHGDGRAYASIVGGEINVTNTSLEHLVRIFCGPRVKEM